jgi:hypothetical protein
MASVASARPEDPGSRKRQVVAGCRWVGDGGGGDLLSATDSNRRDEPVAPTRHRGDVAGAPGSSPKARLSAAMLTFRLQSSTTVSGQTRAMRSRLLRS